MKRVIAVALLFMCSLLASRAGLAQALKGIITDSLGKAVPYANAKLMSSTNLLIAYSVSNEKGAYTIAVPADADKKDLRIEVTCIGFKKQSIAVNDFNAPYNFKLTGAANQLKAVTIKDKTPRLKAHGDTLDYRVSDFTSPQDRVIGDVIKKLPGVEVDANGKISYNGKAISNFYIGGDNLLDDKYNIATSTIPSAAVDKVQVLENNQPIKMLRDKVVSDNVALNITLKNDAKMQMMGQSNIGGGMPEKYDGNINAMMFKDKYKAINYLKGNNTGIDVSSDLTSHNLSSILSRQDNSKPNNLLSLGAAGNPNLPTNRYLFNQSGLINLNNLVNIAKDVQVKGNVSYLHDSQYQNYSKISENYQPNDTIRYTELQDNRHRPDLLHAQATLNINKTGYYLNNNLATDYEHNAAYSGLNTNRMGSDQTLKNSRLDFSNEFNIMKTTKAGNIYEGYSYVNRINNPESRVLLPGYNYSYEALFNQGQSYAQLLQTVNIPTWYTNNYVSFRHPGSKLTQSYRAGVTWQAQNLVSALSSVQSDGTVLPATSSATNNLDWNKTKYYASAAYDIPGDKFKLNLQLPLSLQQISYSDGLYALNKSLSRLYFDPVLSARYATGAEQYISAGYNYRNSIGDITEAYRGNILTNYRTLMANNANLTERKVQSASLGYVYRKAIKMFFWNINGSYSRFDANNITSSILTDNFSRRVVLPFENSGDSWSASGGISKYVYGLHTTFSAGANWQKSRSNQLQNNVLLPYNTIVNGANGGIETKLSDKLNVSYKLYVTRTHTRTSVAGAAGATSTQLQHQGAINYNPLNNLFLRLSGDHYYTSQSLNSDLNYSFADFSARYKINKLKTDIELNMLNLFDTKTYSMPYLSANTFTNSVYTLPGRMMTMKISFNF